MAATGFLLFRAMKLHTTPDERMPRLRTSGHGGRLICGRDIGVQAGRVLLLPALLFAAMLGVPRAASGADHRPAHPPAHAAAPSPAAAPSTNAPAALSAKELEAKWGVQVSTLRVSGQGHFIDFRYRVTDPEKAAVMSGTKEKPLLIDQETGARLHVPSAPKVGQLRSTAKTLQAGKIYTALFSNSQGAVKAGHKVTVVFGDFRAENLVVTD